MRKLIMSVMCGVLFYLLVMSVVQCFTAGRIGSIPEEEAEDENFD